MTLRLATACLNRIDELARKDRRDRAEWLRIKIEEDWVPSPPAAAPAQRAA